MIQVLYSVVQEDKISLLAYADNFPNLGASEIQSLALKFNFGIIPRNILSLQKGNLRKSQNKILVKIKESTISKDALHKN